MEKAEAIAAKEVASLLLVEILNILPLERKQKINLHIIACFSIGFGAVLTPVGEPLATVVVSRLNTDFFFFIRELGIYIIPGIIVLGLIRLFYIRNSGKKTQIDSSVKDLIEDEETYKEGFIRAGKIFIFVFALELLGAGFKPLIDNYVIHFSSRILYWLNMI